MKDDLFLKHTEDQYHDQFGKEGAKIGTVLRIRLPNDYTVMTGPNPFDVPTPIEPIPVLGVREVAVIGVAAVLAKNPTVSRRFWWK